MDSTAIILLSSLTVLAVIDFLNLKKSKLPIKKLVYSCDWLRNRLQ